MKLHATVIASFLATFLFGAAVLAAPAKFGNALDGRQVDVLPKIEVPQTIQLPTETVIWEFQKKKGWRKVFLVEDPKEGFRVETYSVKVRDEETCILVPSNVVDIATEQAAADEAKAQADADAAAATEAAKVAEEIAWRKLQTDYRTLSPHVVKGIVSALVDAINKYDAFSGNPIRTEDVLKAIETIVAAEIDASIAADVVIMPAIRITPVLEKAVPKP